MKPRLAHVITGLQTGGAELMLERLLNLRTESAFDPFVICLTSDGPTGDRIRAAGTPVTCLNFRPGLPNPLTIKRIRDVLKQERTDLVQTWLYHADLLGGLAARSAGLPVNWSIHRSSLDPAVTSRSVIWTARACRSIAGSVPARIVCCSEASVVAHTAFGYPAAKLTEIPNGFDLDDFRPDPCLRQQVRASLGLAPASIVVGIIGRYVPLKNHSMFVAAAGIAAQSNPDLAFLMIGDGLDAGNTELTELIRATGFAERFHLLGRRPDTAALLNGMDLFALTSNTEAFPLVIGEAMACQVPCIATDVGDCRRIIEDTGRLVAPGDTQSLATAISALASDPAMRTRLGQNARQRIADHFTIGEIALRFDDLWLETLNRPAR